MADEGQAAMAQFEAVQQRLQAMDARMSRLQENATELRRARDTLAAMEEQDDGQDGLVPIGGGVHLRAQIDPSQRVIAPLGRGYAAEQDIGAAKAQVQQRLDEVNEALQSDQQEAQQLAQVAQQLAQQLQGS